MVPDWKALLPHRPLDPDTDQYVPPPTNGGERIAQWILADRTTVLVAGPVGIGKSTELARAAKLLQAERVACLVRLDRFENMKRVTVDQLLLRTASQLAIHAIKTLKMNISSSLHDAFVRAGLFPESLMSAVAGALLSTLGRGAVVPAGPFEGSPSSLLSATIAEVANRTSQRVTLLIDGLEKCPDGPATAEIFEALGMLSDDVDIVAVLPWSLAFGAGSETILRPGDHLVALRAPEVEGEPGEPGREFLRGLLARRLPGIDLPVDRLDVFDHAAVASGGIPRTFLQLVADAGTYARIRRKDPWPSWTDLSDAVADQSDSFRRVLRKGDSDAILAVAGHDGRELDLDRRIRLLSHGALLERVRDGAPVLTIHPFVDPLIRGPNRA